MSLTPTVKALSGLITLLALLGLGILARSAPVTRRDLAVDVHAEHLRDPLATAVALGLTAAASEAVGIALLVIGLVVLVLQRRRYDAARLAAAVGGSWVLGIAVKSLIDRHRPPESLWLLAPDSAGSFPSGHDTTACAVILIALAALRGTGGLRVAGALLAAAYAVAVGASRIYLGDHYPTDVAGSWLVVATAACFVAAAADLAPVRRRAALVLRDPVALPSAG